MSRPHPSFFSRDWRAPAARPAPVAVRLGRRAGTDVDLDQVAARCDALLAELATAMGLSWPQPCVATRADQDDLVTVEVVEEPRLVVTQPPGRHGERCGFGVGLDADARAAVLAVERVFLDEPSLLLAAGAAPLVWQLPVPELGADPDLVAALLDRGVDLTRVTAAAAAYAGREDTVSRAADISTWLNDVTVGVEVVGPVDDDRRAQWQVQAAGVLEGAPLGLGVVQLPASVRPAATAVLADETPWASAGDIARLVVGALPVALLPDPYDPDAGLTTQVHHELGRTAWRSVDEVTVAMRLDRLATFAPHSVRAVRLLVDDRRLATLISAASRHVTITDIWALVDDLLEHGVPDDLLTDPAIGPRLLARHLSVHLRQVATLGVVAVDPGLEREVASWGSSGAVRDKATVLADVLRRLSLILPGAPWAPEPAVAIVLDDGDARDALRDAVRHQAPGTLVVTAAELRSDVPRTTIGRLQLPATHDEEA